MVTVPLTVPGTPHGTDELLLELPELPELPEPLELFELPQHELELLDDDDVVTDDDDTDGLEPTLEPELPLDPEVMALPHEMAVGLSRRAARRCRPKADAICGSTVTNRTKLAIAMIATCDRRRQSFISDLVPARSG
jgi:hypothetical protein